MKKSLNVYVDMVCDLFHPNHINFMKNAIEAGKEKHIRSAVNWPHVNLIVGIHDDDTITEYKELPAMTLEETEGKSLKVMFKTDTEVKFCGFVTAGDASIVLDDSDVKGILEAARSGDIKRAIDADGLIALF